MNSSVIEEAADYERSRSRRTLIWDWPVRVVHWLFVLGVIAAYVTAKSGLTDWHARIGATLLGLLVFRIVWGFVGSHHARFAHFFPTPHRIRSYARGEWRGHGHTPLGALSVFALLLLLAAQIATGLLSNDDIAFQGPLVAYISKSTSDAVSAWHERIFYTLLAFILIHIAAVVFYAVVKKKNLLTPMLTGWKSSAIGQVMSDARVKLGAFVLAATLACAVVWYAFGVPHQTQPPPAPAAAPAW